MSGGEVMDSISRRNMLAATAAGGLLTAASVAAAQTEGIPQPRRPGHGGTDPGPRNLMREGQNPDVLVPPSTDHGSLPNLRFSFSDASTGLFTGGWTRQVTGRARDALAQGRRVGVHVVRQRAHHGRGRTRSELRR